MYLIQLTKQKKIEEIKKYLLNNPSIQTYKGSLFIHFLAELYKGIGYLTTIVEKKEDMGVDLLLRHPHYPFQVSWAIQGKCHKRPLAIDKIVPDLHKYYNKAMKAYNCKQYRMVSVSGFVSNANKLEEENVLKEFMLLSSWEYIENLIKQYDPDKYEIPQFELSPLNEIAAGNVSRLLCTEGLAAIIQPTGTGKSGIIYKTLCSYADEKKLVIAPNTAILKQYKDEYRWSIPNTEYMTYSYLIRRTSQEIKQLDISLLVLDEYHRAGADEWGKKIQKLINSHPELKIVGASATPTRYLDGNRDMTQELFKNNKASDISFEQAIVKEMLPIPIYVSALYSIKEEYELLLKKITTSKSDEEAAFLIDKLNAAKIDWESCNGIPSIMDKYIRPEDWKFIVFCESEEHLRNMRVEVEKWFRKSDSFKNRDIQRYTVMNKYSKYENNKQLDDFRKAKDNRKLHLLFAINMLNEGIHIKDVSGAILLRSTVSPTIYFQQIGRALETDKPFRPLIFDFVNNFNAIRSNELFNNVAEAEDEENRKRSTVGLPSINILKFLSINDETKDIQRLFQEIEQHIKPKWERMYGELVVYWKENGHCMVPYDYFNQRLARWIVTQRQFYKKQQLSLDRIQKLEAKGFIWDPAQYNWDEMYKVMLNYFEVNGHCDVPRNFENKRLAQWVGEQRSRKKNSTITDEQQERLESIGFKWSLVANNGETLFQQLVIFNEENGHCNVPIDYENKPLARWVGRQRTKFNCGKLSDEEIERLQSIGFVFNPFKDKWNNNYEQLVAFKKEFGHCNIPQRDKNGLGLWVHSQRQQKKQGNLPAEQIEKLDRLNFDWDPLETNWNNMFKELEGYIQKKGNCFVPRSGEYKVLSIWATRQRKEYIKGTLSKERIELLNSINFDWDPLETKWTEMCNILFIHFKEKGTGNLPKKSENPPLYKWVGAQIQSFREGKLSNKRLKKLKEIGLTFL
ncbi:Helicase associated domain protein [Neobacillus sp. FSL H8-0543]|uniref:Helicase associated domain protein n=1 Tax=Neobacillus sp. FSL H8-0543 TaxID=2954672 RepID=UPI0031584F8A